MSVNSIIKKCRSHSRMLLSVRGVCVCVVCVCVACVCVCVCVVYVPVNACLDPKLVRGVCVWR